MTDQERFKQWLRNFDAPELFDPLQFAIAFAEAAWEEGRRQAIEECAVVARDREKQAENLESLSPFDECVGGERFAAWEIAQSLEALLPPGSTDIRKSIRAEVIEECAALLERDYKECTTDDDRAMVGMCAPATLRALLK